jgi:hypothetical protein
LTQQGSGVDDGIYYHESTPKDIVLTVTSDWDRNQWRFARLFSREKDDLVGWFELSPGIAAYGVWKNNGDYNTARFDKIADMTVDDNCIPRGVHFIDVNGDGKSTPDLTFLILNHQTLSLSPDVSDFICSSIFWLMTSPM